MVRSRCDLCDDEDAMMRCDDCHYNFCALCSTAVHEDATRTHHLPYMISQMQQSRVGLEPSSSPAAQQTIASGNVAGNVTEYGAPVAAYGNEKYGLACNLHTTGPAQDDLIQLEWKMNALNEEIRLLHSSTPKTHTAQIHALPAPIERCGLGLRLSHASPDKLSVDLVLPGGAAEQSGRLRRGDKILAVNGNATGGLVDAEAVACALVGVEGSFATLLVSRPGAGEAPFELALERRMFEGQFDSIHSVENIFPSVEGQASYNDTTGSAGHRPKANSLPISGALLQQSFNVQGQRPNSLPVNSSLSSLPAGAAALLQLSFNVQDDDDFITAPSSPKSKGPRSAPLPSESATRSIDDLVAALDEKKKALDRALDGGNHAHGIEQRSALSNQNPSSTAFSEPQTKLLQERLERAISRGAPPRCETSIDVLLEKYARPPAPLSAQPAPETSGISASVISGTNDTDHEVELQEVELQAKAHKMEFQPLPLEEKPLEEDGSLEHDQILEHSMRSTEKLRQKLEESPVTAQRQASLVRNTHENVLNGAKSPLSSPGGEQAKAIENAPVQLIMTLGLDFSMAGSEGSDEREKFKRDVAQDLASASGLPPANFRIKDVSPGSIILDIVVMPDLLSPGRHLLAAKDLAEQAVDPSSQLRSGKITSHATGVQVLPAAPPFPPVSGHDVGAEAFSPVSVQEHKGNPPDDAAARSAAVAEATAGDFNDTGIKDESFMPSKLPAQPLTAPPGLGSYAPNPEQNAGASVSLVTTPAFLGSVASMPENSASQPPSPGGSGNLESESVRVLRKGWLTKEAASGLKSMFVKSQKRWCVLRAGCFQYFHRETEDGRSEVISFKSMESVSIETKKNIPALIIKTPHRVFSFVSSDKSDATTVFEWLQEITRALMEAPAQRAPTIPPFERAPTIPTFERPSSCANDSTSATANVGARLPSVSGATEAVPCNTRSSHAASAPPQQSPMLLQTSGDAAPAPYPTQVVVLLPVANATQQAQQLLPTAPHASMANALPTAQLMAPMAAPQTAPMLHNAAHLEHRSAHMPYGGVVAPPLPPDAHHCPPNAWPHNATPMSYSGTNTQPAQEWIATGYADAAPMAHSVPRIAQWAPPMAPWQGAQGAEGAQMLRPSPHSMPPLLPPSGFIPQGTSSQSVAVAHPMAHGADYHTVMHAEMPRPFAPFPQSMPPMLPQWVPPVAPQGASLKQPPQSDVTHPHALATHPHALATHPYAHYNLSPPQQHSHEPEQLVTQEFDLYTSITQKYEQDACASRTGVLISADVSPSMAFMSEPKPPPPFY